MVLIVNDLFCLYDIQVTHTKFIYKLRNLLELLNHPKTKYIIRSILKNVSDIFEFLGIKGLGTLKALRPPNISEHKYATL